MLPPKPNSCVARALPLSRSLARRRRPLLLLLLLSFPRYLSTASRRPTSF
jgi:hypothetical protein